MMKLTDEIIALDAKIFTIKDHNQQVRYPSDRTLKTLAGMEKRVEEIIVERLELSNFMLAEYDKEGNYESISR